MKNVPESLESRPRRFTAQVMIKVSPAMKEQIERAAREVDRPVSVFLRRAIAKTLREREAELV
jgi:predicted transcriptional regulator